MSFGSNFGVAYGGSETTDTPIPTPADPANVWTLIVVLDSINVSARITGIVTVEAEESVSRIAKFTLRPTDGLVDVQDWVGSSVTIDYDPIPGDAERLFSGVVSEPLYDSKTRLVSFICTDNLQNHFELMTEAQILAAIPGSYYSDDFFGDRRDGWTQAEDILSTVRMGYDLLKDGTTPALTSWQPVSLSALAYNDTSSRNVEVTLSRLRELTNKIYISADYRFTRLHHREHDFSWSMGRFCDYLGQSHELPTRDMISNAAEGLEWTNKNGNICFESLPESGTYCDDQNWVIDEALRDSIVAGASWRAVRRWAQTVTEEYSIVIREAGSITQYGENPQEDSSGIEVEYDDVGWETSLGTDDPGFTTGGALADYENDDCGAGSLTPTDSWVWEDEDDETERLNFLNTAIQYGITLIHASHRRNYVSWQTWINPDIERTQTLEISADGVNAKGKVFQYKHVLDILKGSALTTIKIAVYKCPSGGSVDADTPPSRPDTESGYGEPDESTEFDTHIGGDDSVASYSESWSGFTGNYSVLVGLPKEDQVYPRRFKTTGADIEDSARDEITGASNSTYDIAIMNGLLTVTA